jgi:hypothetical protein
MNKSIGASSEKTPSNEQVEADLRARRERSIRRWAAIGALVALFLGGLGLIEAFDDFELGTVLLAFAAALFVIGAKWANKANNHLLFQLARAGAFLAVLGAIAFALIDPTDNSALEASQPPAASKPSRPHEPTEVAQVPVEGRPRAIAAQGRYVWVVGFDDEESAGVLSRIDSRHLGSSAETMEEFQAKNPYDIAIGHKAVWVTDGGSLIKFDLHGRKLWRKSFGNEQFGNEVDVGLGRVWFKQTWPGRLVVLKPGSGETIKTITLRRPSPREATAIASGFHSVWVSSAEGESSVVFRFDQQGNRTGAIEVQNSPQDMAAGERLLFVAHADSSLVTRIDPQPSPGREIVNDIKLQGDPPGGIATGAGAVWIPYEGNGILFALSQCSWKRLGHKESGEDPLDVVVLKDKAYVPNKNSGNVSVFELKTPLPKKEKACPPGP